MVHQSDTTILSDVLITAKASSDFILLTGTSNLPLARKIAKLLGKPIHNPVTKFADGETRIQIPVNIRRGSVIIIQSTCPPDINGAVMELLLMIDAAKRASAGEIIVVIPYFGYARQDRKDRPRVPISSAVMARAIEFAGADKICTIDIHSEQLQGFVKAPWDNLYSSYCMIPRLEKENFTDLIIASPDKGGVPAATAYAKRLDAQGVAIVYKVRDVLNHDQSEALDIIGDVKDKEVLLVDDMVTTAGTLCNAAELIKRKGAKKIWAAVTHGIFTEGALEKIIASPIEKILVTDTTPQRKEITDCPKVEVVSIAALLAEAIVRIESGRSLSEKLIIR